MAKLTSIAATRLRGAVAMLRARPINDVLARAERIQLLCVFCGFGSRRSMATCVRRTRQPAAASGRLLQRVKQRATAGSDRCDRFRFLSVQKGLLPFFVQKKNPAKCENDRASGMQDTSISFRAVQPVYQHS